MKKLFAFLLVVAMATSLVACGGTSAEQGNNGGNKDDNKGTVVTVENWQNYLEFVVETSTEEGFLDFRLYLKAKDGVSLSNDINTQVHFSYNVNKHHYTKENNTIILGTCEPLEGAYTDSYYMYRNENKKEYCEQLDGLNGVSWSFNDGNRWTIIPHSVVITEIVGTIIAK